MAKVAAGSFGRWLAEMGAALRGEAEADVPCGSCTACCRSSQFIHIAPDETDALAHIPVDLVFPAPMAPKGHVLMGYDEQGCCPMLVDGACSIYAHRPRTCRTYDCRVFPAAGIVLDDADKAAIADQAQRWVFAHPGEDDQARHAAVIAAATYLRTQSHLLAPGLVPPTTTHLAVLAVEIHEAFLSDESPSPDEVAAAITRARS